MPDNRPLAFVPGAAAAFGCYPYGASVMTEDVEEVDQHIRHVAAALGLSIIGPFAHGTFGAVAVATADGEELVLKAQPDPTLEPVWATGAEMAERLHERGYPNPRILRVGSTGAAVWSLQERVAGDVLRRLTLTHAAQLITLAGRHDIDSGRCRPWREDAIAAARDWLNSTPIDPTHAGARRGDRSWRGCRDAADDDCPRRLPPRQRPGGWRRRHWRARLGNRRSRRLAVRPGDARLRLSHPAGFLRAGGVRVGHRGGSLPMPRRRGGADDGVPGATSGVDDRRAIARQRRQGMRADGWQRSTAGCDDGRASHQT